MLALTNNPESSLFQYADGLKVIDAGQLGHG